MESNYNVITSTYNCNYKVITSHFLYILSICCAMLFFLSYPTPVQATEVTNPFFIPSHSPSLHVSSEARPKQSLREKNQSITLLNKPEQGALVYGKTGQGTKVYFENKELKTTPAGAFVFALPLDAPDTVTLETDDHIFTYDVTTRAWKTDIVDGLPPEKVILSDADQKRVDRESKRVENARKQASSKFQLPTCFSRPVKNNTRVSSPFGATRVLNGIKKAPHNATDYAAPTGTVISAPQDGKVIFTDSDLFYTGKTVLIDHGFSLISSYSHLNSITVKPGQTIKRGQTIGTVGDTGRANGPHLHFVLSWNNTRVDPEQVFNAFPCK